MLQPWFKLMMLAAESQQVIFLRTLKLMAGGAAAKTEARRMVSEKVEMAALEGGRLALGASPGSVVRRYRKKVKANRQRLLK
jgi:hypothetical protein